MAVGAKLWLVRPLGFRMDEKTLRRAGLDYWQHLQWEAVDDWNELKGRLASHSFWYFTKTAARAYTSARFQSDDVLVFGSETQGLPSKLLAANEPHCLNIPMRQEARSLNLSNAVAVGLYEATRQLG